MGIKSTYTISRKTAINVILTKVHEATNRQLAMMLEEFEESHFRNYSVKNEIPDAVEEINEWGEGFIIRNLRDF